MKKFTKLFLTCAAVTGLAAAMGTSAMAMTASYSDGVVTLDGVEYTEGTQQTLLILNNDATTVAETDIVQIDQQGEAFATVTVGELDVDNNTYYVRVGGEDGTIQTATFGLAATSTRLLGDADNNGSITSSDASVVLRHIVGTVTLTGDSLQAADADDSGDISSSDAAEILGYTVGNSSNVDGVKTISDKKNTVAE